MLSVAGMFCAPAVEPQTGQPGPVLAPEQLPPCHASHTWDSCCPPQGVSLEDVSKVLRSRFGTSGIEEKASRPPKPQA